MAIEVKHKFKSEMADGPNEELVQPSHWNDTHEIEVSGESVVGRPDAGDGAATSIPLSKYDEAPEEGQIARFSTNGRFRVGDPVEPHDAVHKEYADQFLPRTGGAISGPLELPSMDPVAISFTPKGDYPTYHYGTSGAGNTGIWDHTNNMWVIRFNRNSELLWLNSNVDVNGAISARDAPSAANHLTRKDYVDGAVSNKVNRHNISIAGLYQDDLSQPFFRRISDGSDALLQPRLGFTPIQQGGGTGQGANKIRIGWGGSGVLMLQVDNVNFSSTWPININGTANALTGGWTPDYIQNQLNWRVTDARSSGWVEWVTGTLALNTWNDSSGYYITSFYLSTSPVIGDSRLSYRTISRFAARQPQIYIPNVGWRALGGW